MLRRTVSRAAPLSGLTCLELGNVLATPGAGQFLAELGCDVVKARRGAGGLLVAKYWHHESELFAFGSALRVAV